MIVSFQSLAYQDSEKVFREVLERGMEGVEIVSGIYRREKKHFSKIRKLCRDYCIRSAFHLSPQWFAGNINPVIRKHFLRCAEFFVDVCGKSEMNPFTLHCFDTLHMYFSKRTKEKMIKNCIEEVEHILKRCTEYGITLSLEVYPLFNKKLRRKSISPLRLLELVKELKRRGYENVGITFDAEHINSYACNITEFLTKCKKYITQVHLSDNDGKAQHQHLPIGSGKLPLKKCLKVLKSFYRGMLVIEVAKIEDVVKSYIGLLDMLKKL
ncbi:MAG: sugar phosphate isomerase/epimerase [Candidatus Micrarchaeota archaeon]|nr:sugar phosphate isomerase/epimerase [Candidatus Micrarchaeota archaeon]